MPFHVLAGDETDLPGIARILEGLPETALGHAFIEVGTAQEIQRLAHPPGFNVRWLIRDRDVKTLVRAVRSVEWPRDLDNAFFWAGTEYSAFRALRTFWPRRSSFPPGAA